MQKCVYVPNVLQIVFAPGLPGLNPSELAEDAPGLTGLSETGTELQFELCCGDDPAGVKPTTFRAGRDFAILRMVSSTSSVPCAFPLSHDSALVNSEARMTAREKSIVHVEQLEQFH